MAEKQKAWGQILNLELFHPLSAATETACTDRNRDGFIFDIFVGNTEVRKP